MADLDLGPLLAAAIDAAHDAAREILDVYAGDFAVARKSDQSPVTLADARAEAVILPRLMAAAPDIPVISEEQAEATGLPAAAAERFWLVDPLDGTKEFIKRNGEFTVNIALIEAGRPILGVVGIPAQGLIYAAAGPGTAGRHDASGTRTAIAARACPPEGAVVMSSRSHETNTDLDALLARRKVAERRIAGSALKFCRVAEGAADLYPRIGPTMEWDTAAGQAVLEAAGGRMTRLDGTPFTYGKPGFRNPGFVAEGR
ncbi:3'(2'),5'-bisphosphate nucleotidase CysQ [Aliidongia dinghuensis]|uniref:3'(2'),5'-bisphosphate nucleotidase CysQ n=1 Tax=Aliidongia dinghuensis TaxID=1867774 RepID=A0A8J3E409_9PROT|nr:3'(2'),5'-bisphosphate nucleotidase CysQ [Aliidongia dinghuensis]GGF23184.1 3'(2'),5'-bisphosphate nucleotidase CysQ [Aliidongia dinghuensis]